MRKTEKHAQRRTVEPPGRRDTRDPGIEAGAVEGKS